MLFALLVLLIPGLVVPVEAPTVRTVFGTGEHPVAGRHVARRHDVRIE